MTVIYALNPESDPLLGIVGVFLSHDVEFVVVGSYCLLLQGYTMAYQTHDVGLMMAPGERNYRRALAAVQELRGIEISSTGHWEPGYVEHWKELAVPSVVLLDSKLGRLNVMRVVSGRDYPYVLKHSIETVVSMRGKSHRIRCLTVDEYVRMKAGASRRKDADMVEWLRSEHGIVPTVR